MHVDSHYMIGKSHAVCQDYATHCIDNAIENHPLASLSICDGCSSSPNTDIGARILAHKAQSEDWIDDDIGKQVILMAATALRTISLSKPLCEETLDATLLHAEAIDASVHIWIHGDGYWYIRDRDGDELYCEISYSGNAPQYLSYYLDAGRRKRYYHEYGGEPHYRFRAVYNGEPRAIKVPQYSLSHISCDNCDFVALFTDGVASIPDRDPFDVIAELVKFPNRSGCCVQRRLKRYLADCAKHGVYPQDDIGMGVIFL